VKAGTIRMVCMAITTENPVDLRVTVCTKVNTTPSTWSQLVNMQPLTTFVTVLVHGDCLEVVIAATITHQTGSCNLGTPKTLIESCLTRFTAKYNNVCVESAANIRFGLRYTL